VAWTACASLLRTDETVPILPSSSRNVFPHEGMGPFYTYYMHKTVAASLKSDSLGIILSLEVAYSKYVWRTRCEAVCCESQVSSVQDTRRGQSSDSTVK
jgi:hypothetical protein